MTLEVVLAIFMLGFAVGAGSLGVVLIWMEKRWGPGGWDR